MSVTVLRVPRVVARVIVAPPMVRSFAFASLTRTVIVEVELPFAGIEERLGVIVVVDADAAPGVNVTAAVFAITEPLTVPVMLAVPGTVDDVSVAV